MLSFRKALFLACAVLAFIFIFDPLHHVRSQPPPPAYRNANDMPKPASMTKSKPQPSKQEAHPQDAAQTSTKTFSNADAPATKVRPQIALDVLHRKPLREQLEYQFPYDVDAKFPAFIWQTWKYTPDSGDFKEEFREPEASWTIHHPTFVHEVITDDVAVHLIRHLYASVPAIVEAYNALPLPVMKADFFRYLILLARGGIYSDIDTVALKSAADWVPQDVPAQTYGMVIGIEADPDRPDWKEWYSRRIQFCQWTIQSKPGHPILVDVVANITEETLKRKFENRLNKDHEGIIEFTGPGLWTDAIFDYFNSPVYFDLANSPQGNISWQHFTHMKAPKKVGDVIVLPITSFSPGIKTMDAGEEDDPMAFVKHNFEGTWKPEELRHIGEIFN